MLQLLNRFAWFLSLCMGLVAGYIIAPYDGVGFILGIIGGFFIKQIFFSKAYIEQRIEFFAHQIEKRISGHTAEEKVKNELPEMFTAQKEETSEAENFQETYMYEPEKYNALTNNTQEVTDTLTEDSPQDEERKYQFQPSDAISKFFSENILAKLGGILVFLGVFFFLALIYTIVGPVTKLIIGFAIGATTFTAGAWLDTKGHTQESRIVLGTAILINYLVILGGRYLLTGDTEAGTLLPVGITFLFLILNTVFAVTTSLVYKSHTLLIFSFVFAYINPLLLGSPSEEPYTLLGYTMIVTLGAMFMSYTRKDINLFVLSFLFSAFLFLAAPWTDANGWIAKLLCINTLGALSLYVSTVFQKRYQYLSELLIGGTFFLIGILGILDIISLSAFQLALLGASSLGLMLFCYMSFHKGAYLFSIGTLGAVLTLTPSLIISARESSLLAISASIIFIFALCNIGLVLQKNKNLIAENIGNILGGLISGAIFLTYMIYTYGTLYFPGMAQGFVFFGLASVYAGTAFFLVQTIGVETMKSQEKYRNIFYVLAALAISLFSLAVAFVFAENKEIVALIWLLESNILFYFGKKLRSEKILFAGVVLHTIGVLRILPFLDMDLNQNYGFLVTAILMLLSLMWNLFTLMKSKDEAGKSFIGIELYGMHHFFHVIGISAMSIFILSIFQIQNEWELLFGASIILAALGYIYMLAGSQGLQKVHMVAYLGGLFLHIALFMDDIGRDSLNLGLSTLIVLVYTLPFVIEYLQKQKLKNLALFAAYLGYLFLLSTLYIYHIFDSTFAITLYWGILSFGLLSYGIQKDIIPLRTLGLYLISLTAGKIFFYDIWIGMDNTVTRVAALMVVGILMIILSTMYTRKYGNTLNTEFNPENLFQKKTSDTPPLQEDTPLEIKKSPKKKTIQEDIEDMQIEDDIVGVRMYITGNEKPIQIRAQNLIKIAKLIEKTLKKKEFQAGELSDIYTLVTQNYQSSLSPEQYKKIEDIVAQFVKKGGKMEFVSK